ncbi:alcohol dehydrogenase GroES domain protein [Hyaloraphidium curvatum]|nr:alcohol dehydrogenase GroES domain protein [Hyaloraphidium curvatum]
MAPMGPEKRVSQKAVEWNQPLQRIEEPAPEPQGTEVLIRITSSGLCHSDLHLIEGHMDLGGGNKLPVEALGGKRPLVPGHEMVGEVAKLGPDAKGVEVGRKYIVYPWLGCGQDSCARCSTGAEQLCTNGSRWHSVQLDGGFSTHVVSPHPKYLVPFENVSEEFASTLACSGLTAYGAIQKSLVDLPDGFTEKDKLLINGAGGLGTQAIKIVRALFPNYKPSVADIDPKKREAALAAGAGEAIDPNDPAQVGAIAGAAATGQGGYARIIDFVGAGKSVETLVPMLRRIGSTLTVVGLFGGAATLPVPMFVMQNWRLQGHLVGSLPELKELVKLADAGKVDEIPIVKRKLSEANQTIEDLKAGKIIGRAVFKPQEGA